MREALLNCIVHRDYSYSGSTLINIYDDRMEYVSLGGLVRGLELNSIFLGVSVPRNPNLAAIFYRMRLIESYGTGISKIRRGYADSAAKPKFEAAKGIFRVTLPNRNFEAHSYSGKEDEPSEHVSPDAKTRLHNQKRIIMNYAEDHGQITRKQTEELLSVGSTKAYHLLDELCDEKKLVPAGSGRTRRYLPG